MIACALVAALTSFLLQPVVLAWLRRVNMLDVPNARSSHSTPVYRGGGIAVVAAMVLAQTLLWLSGSDVEWSLVAAVVAFAAVGLLDDRRSLPVSLRLGAQLTIGLAVVLLILGLPGVQSPDSVEAWLAAIVLGTVWVAGYTNSFNFMDGVNGISVLNAVLGGGLFAGVGVWYDVPGLSVMGAALAGAALGFLPWNAPRARVFLGDVGSYALGAGLATMALWSVLAGVPVLVCGCPLVIYLADTGFALASRVVRRQPWRQAHRDHIYQRLTDAGMTHLGVALLNVAAAALVVAAVLVAAAAGSSGMGAVLSLAVVGGYLALPHLRSASAVPQDERGTA